MMAVILGIGASFDRAFDERCILAAAYSHCMIVATLKGLEQLSNCVYDQLCVCLVEQNIPTSYTRACKPEVGSMRMFWPAQP